MCDKTHRAFHLELVKLDLHLLLSLFILDQLAQVSEEVRVEHWKAGMDQFIMRKSLSRSWLNAGKQIHGKSTL